VGFIEAIHGIALQEKHDAHRPEAASVPAKGAAN
jgi:hypothetical protein